MMLLILSAVAGYLLGSFSTAVVLSVYRKKTDVRTLGSGNAGATNMLRSFGWHAGLFTGICDTLKGVLAAFIGFLIAGNIGAVTAGLFAVIGHTYPIYFRFHGGKGITVTLGITLFLSPVIAITSLIPALLIIYFSHTVSLGSLIGNLLIVVLTWCFKSAELVLCITTTLVFLLNLFSHRMNIKRLFSGTENKMNWEEYDVKHKRRSE